jgi:hypothetical protein
LRVGLGVGAFVGPLVVSGIQIGTAGRRKCNQDARRN